MKHSTLFFAGIALALAAGCATKPKTPFSDVVADADSLVPPSTPAEVAAPLPDPASTASTTSTATTPAIITSTPATLPASQTLAIAVDEHGNMTRGFPVSNLQTPSREIIAGPTYWPDLNLTQKRSDFQNFLFEPFEFVLSTAMLPVRAVATPPWKRVLYTPVPADDATPATAYDRQIITTEQLEK